MKKTDTSWIELDAPCWLQEGDSFLQGTVTQCQPLICQTDKGPLQPNQIYQRNPNSEVMDDLIDLTILNEAELLNSIILRYQGNHYQTYMGPSLIVVNPVKEQPQNAQLEQIYHTLKEVPPHIYAIANRTLVECHKKMQTIIISGESGAGKTENAKLCMRFLIGQHAKKILQCNPILESFGNAKTQRNANSSRFGKLISLYFDHEFKSKGVLFTNYLLEKSRVTSVAQGERNFHIFYQFLQGYPNLSLFKLTQNLDQYEYIKKTHYMQNDGQNYQELVKALQALGFNVDSIFGIVASILLVGNVQFEEIEQGCQVKDQNLTAKISSLLGISEKELIRCLTTKTRQFVKNEVIDTPLSRIECINSQNTLSRYLYDKLFTYLVGQLNQALKPQNYSYQINILDIYGFEVFNNNTFEQLFINYTNEKLLQLYIQYVFKQEATIFQNEGLQGYQGNIKFQDNQNIIDALEKPPLGIFNILDDSCAVAGTDDTFLTKLKNNYQNHQIVQFNKIASPTFRIKHSPKDVEYNIMGFRMKNKDEINKQFQVCLAKSKNHLVAQIYQYPIKGEKYIGGQIRQEMSELMGLLQDSDVQFVRCMKPNDHLQNTNVNQMLLLNQIRYLGILETIKIRKQGYSVRRTYEQFYKEFGYMTNYALYPLLTKNEFKPLVQKMIEQYFKFNEQQVLFGFTMIFMKLEVYQQIVQEYNIALQEKNSAAFMIQNAWICYKNAMIFKLFIFRMKIIQANIRGHLVRKHYKQLLTKIIIIQRNIKKYLDKCRIKQFRQVSLVIQKYIKRMYAMKYMLVEEQAIIRIQRFFRELLYQRKVQRYNQMTDLVDGVFDRSWRVILWRAATRIQKVWRGIQVRTKYHDQVQQIRLAGFLNVADRAAIVIQAYVRRYLQQNFYLRLKWATSYIQGYFRTRWLSQLYNRVRYAAILIQRAVRSYLKEQRVNKLFHLKVLKPMELDLNRLRDMEFKNLHEDDLLSQGDLQEGSKRIDLFSQVVDVEVLCDMSEIYDSLWTTLYKRCFKESYEKCNFLQTYALGECHTYATSQLGRVYSWGMNDYQQQGSNVIVNNSKINQLQTNLKIKILKSGSNHGCFLSTENVLYTTLSDKPILHQVKMFDVYNNEMIAVDEQQLIYTWSTRSLRPQELKSWTAFLRMSQVQQKMAVHQISHGLNFFIILTTNGLVFSMGENSSGELGVGQKSTKELSIVELQDKISEVHCGMKHTIAKSSLGRVYAWGGGQHGQLGQGTTKDECTPKQVQLDGKALQVMAGHKQSIVLMENRKVYWWGSNGCLLVQTKPIEFVTTHPVVRVLSSWSRTLSIVYLTYANCHKLMENNIKLRSKLLSSLTQKWCENDLFSIDPPYCESLVNHFSQMKKPQIKPNIKFASKIEHQHLVKSLQQQQQQQQQSHTQNTSSFFSFTEENNILQQRDMQRMVEEQYKQIGSNQQVKQLKNKINRKEQQDSDAKLKQLRDVKRQYECILQKDELSEIDREFIEILRSSDLMDVLQFIN